MNTSTLNALQNASFGVSQPAKKRRGAWQEPLVWMVVGGPAVVVMASILTAVIAFRGADTVVGSGAEQAPKAPTTGYEAQSPAHWARNHAATPKR